MSTRACVALVSYDLPLNLHAYALPAAVAARCAGEQGHFWDYRDALFRGQAQLGDGPIRPARTALRAWTSRVSPPAATIRSRHPLRDDRRQESGVAKASASTPTFVIGRLVDGEFVGEILAGAQPIEVFEERLETLLQQTQQPASR